ncbi:MAG: hemerythrin family protein [Bacteroides sp.]|nr:hemerythrin family protein [Bacteroides sp.]
MVKKLENFDEVFAWKDQYCVGVEEIDSAHMRLFTIVRRLLKNLMANDYEKNKKTCIEVIKYLKQYTVQHFAEEEAFQIKIGYGGYTNHKRIHDSMRDVTIPALEKHMIESDFSEKSVDHFAGVCAAWLTAHVMLEDQAIVGRTKSMWEANYDSDALSILQARSEQFMNNIFQIHIEAENLNYDGYDIGKSIYYYTIYKDADNNVYRAVTVLNRDLLCFTLGKLMGKTLVTLDEIAMSMIGELTRNFSENFIRSYTGNNIVLLGDGTVEKSRFESDFKTSHPDISMLWNTPYGHIAFSYKAKKAN